MSRINVFFKDENKKNHWQILKEAIHFAFIKRELPKIYFGKYLYRKGIANYKDFLSTKEIDKISNSKNFHKPEYAAILRNKLAFSFYTKKNYISTPMLKSYNLGNVFFFKGKQFSVADINELGKCLNLVFEECNINSLFIKPLADMGGTGCYLILQKNINEQLKIYGHKIIKENFIHQEVVCQHPEINKIYPFSVNTIRFNTYIDKSENINILGSYIRFGINGSVVDNASSGGFYVSISESGEMQEIGNQMMKYGGNIFTNHPDTGFVFAGFKIPFYNEAVELVKEATRSLPDRIIGWDIAITETGPMIIEGNDNNSWFGADIAYGGYLKHPLFKEILEEA